MNKNNFTINKKYDFKHIEQFLYNFWENKNFSNPIYTDKDSYCIMIPPPNITGRLHLGHALQYTIIDVLIRYNRMLGKNTFCQMGMDHAGIATQILVEKKIFKEEGKTRHDYGRDAFIKKIWQLQSESRKVIYNQMRSLGFSIDWKSERFTMDNGLSYAVKEAFIRLYKNNLIYRSKRLVNWDPVLRTAISDLEVEHKVSKGNLWYLRYPLANNVITYDGLNYVVVATSRPETIFGDTAVAVNPNDKRYKNLIGKNVILPIVNRYIPIISDYSVEKNKGSGCVKVTPAHDFQDYEIGKRNKLLMINIFTDNGTLRKEVEIFDTHGNKVIFNSQEKTIPFTFQGLNRFIARNLVIEQLHKLNLLETIENYELIIPYGDRSGSIIEPMLTDQWYIKILPLADLAIKAVKEKKIKFIHKQYKNMYLSWMKNIKDWCISRQLWWGHRIPAWYDEKNNIYVGNDVNEIRKLYNLSKNVKLKQDEDVLDTWFSSGLWTFTSLGWPKNTKFLKLFHPTNVIVSGFDIIFFWIARMIMLTMYLYKDKHGNPQIPFKMVFITGLLRDEEGKKMSKSKGNILDPLDMVNGISLDHLIKKQTFNIIKPQLAKQICNLTKKQFPQGIKPSGTDALRFTLMSLVTSGRDIYWDIKRLEGYRNFCNKLWNASIFVIENANKYYFYKKNSLKLFSLADRWILSKLNETIKLFREALDNYRFDLATHIIYDFTWKQFCDWYLELAKISINQENMEVIYITCSTLIKVLEILLRLSHPIIPFITEHIWQYIKKFTKIKEKTIMHQPFPIYRKSFFDKNATIDIEWIKQLIITIRSIRSEFNIINNKPLKLIFRNITVETITLIKNNKHFIMGLAKLSNISFVNINDKIPESIIKLIDKAELLIPIEDNIIKR